jgi:hypothetical protein
MTMDVRFCVLLQLELCYYRNVQSKKGTFLGWGDYVKQQGGAFKKHFK